uniref:Uncharacterized protein LOC104220962 n=1 Tax=Nicotiana sylvestris TaxID=4096 RepID=A0A1U7VQQ5_NICSY|nr:PREDICTED: uncharacterized protein LOC104220962 [Nicotiana sylvestris]
MSKSSRATSFSKEWKQNLEIVWSYLVKTQNRMKRHADQNRGFDEYQVGDKVMVKIPKRYLFAGVYDPRLLQKYIGPLSIERRIGKVVYRVDTPAWWKIHHVFHRSENANNLLPLDPDIERTLHRGRSESEARTRIKRELDNIVQPQPIKMAGQYVGLSHEDPQRHIQNFLEFADTYNYPNVFKDYIRMTLFLFSLLG